MGFHSAGLAVAVAVAVAVASLSAAAARAAAPRLGPLTAIATHQLGFSGATVSVGEDYRKTKYPVSHRTFILRGPSGRIVRLALSDGGPSDLTSLSLYARKHVGRPDDDESLLIGARDCVVFDPVFLKAAPCRVRPPCVGNGRPDLLYLGQFTWGNGFDLPRGRFGFGWRFLPFEDAIEDTFCGTRSQHPSN